MLERRKYSCRRFCDTMKNLKIVTILSKCLGANSFVLDRPPLLLVHVRVHVRVRMRVRVRVSFGRKHFVNRS